MSTPNEQARDRHATMRAQLEAALDARISTSRGFGATPLGEIGAVGQIRCLVQSILDGFSEERLVEIVPSLIERLEQDGEFPYERISDSESDAIGSRLARCYELSEGITIAESVIEFTRDIIEITLLKGRRKSHRKRRIDPSYCSRCQIPRLSLDIEAELRDSAPRFLDRYQSTVRHILDTPVDTHALIRVPFEDDKSDGEIKLMSLLPLECRERAIRLTLAAGVLRTARDARRTDIAADALRIADNVDLIPFVESRGALTTFIHTKDDPAFDAALDAAFAACGHS